MAKNEYFKDPTDKLEQELKKLKKSGKEPTMEDLEKILKKIKHDGQTKGKDDEYKNPGIQINRWENLSIGSKKSGKK